MAEFTNKNGERITLITNENLQDFFEYVKDKNGYSDDIVISEDVKLADLFAGYETKNQTEQWNLKYAVTKTFNKIWEQKYNAEARKEKLEQAVKEQKSDVEYYERQIQRKDANEDDKKMLKSSREYLAKQNANLDLLHSELTAYKKRAYEGFDLARTNPQAFKGIYEFSGNNSDFGGFYELISDVATENKFSDNLYMAYALIDMAWYPDSVVRGVSDDIRTLSKDKGAIVAKLFFEANEDNNSNGARKNNARKLLFDAGWGMNKGVVARGDFLNYEPKNGGGYQMETPAKIRAKINQYINNENIGDLETKFIFDGQNVEKDLLKTVFESQMNKGDLVQKSGVQEVHDSVAMQRYQQIRQLVLDAADKIVDKYIPNTRGEEKTLTQKYKELIGGFYGKPYAEIALGAVGNDYLLSAAYEDINRGNTAKLEKDSLMLVVQHDSNGYWLKKVAEKEPATAQKIIREYHGSFTARQSRVADVIAPEIALDFDTDYGREHNSGPSDWKMHQRDTGNIFASKDGKLNSEYMNGVADSKHMSMNEKEKFLDEAAHYVEENLVKPAEKVHQTAEEYRADWERCNALSYQVSATETAMQFLKELQKKYNNITECFDKGQPKENEKYLLKENAEEVLVGFTHGSSLGYPPESPLPHLFGRGKEKERREKMKECISEFNITLRDFSDKIWNNEWMKSFDLDAIKGKMLQESTVKQLETEIASVRKQRDQMESVLNQRYATKGQYGREFNLNDAEYADKTLKEAQEKAGKIAKEKEKLLAKKEKKADERNAKKAAYTKRSPLKAVASGMDKNEKAQVRAFNKTIKDVLDR
ncbi:MAG: hypothetical protein MJ212_02345 [Alphaproteobacteria bacterium]|nr:hypothetical protein [Alphaproteobacteria bacterium]